MIVKPEIIVTPDCPTVKFREPREQVDLDKELPRLLHTQGWGVGTYFHVQFISHDRTTLLASGQFVVTETRETLETSEANPYQPMTKTVFRRKARQLGTWFTPDTSQPDGEQESTPEPEVVWNLGKKLHQVKMGDRVVFESADKAQAQEAARDPRLRYQ